MDYSTPFPAARQPRLTGAGGWAPLAAAPQPEPEAEEKEEAPFAWDPCLLSHPGQVREGDGWCVSYQKAAQGLHVPGLPLACHLPTIADPSSPAASCFPAGRPRACPGDQPHRPATEQHPRTGLLPPSPVHQRCGGAASGGGSGSGSTSVCHCPSAAPQPVCLPAPQRQPVGAIAAQAAGRPYACMPCCGRVCLIKDVCVCR